MNNSFIFTQPAATGVEGRESRVESRAATSPRHSNATAQPFSNVLDRAVQTPPKKVVENPKHESLAGGRSAEHQSARSVEAREENKPADAPQRSNRRKDKHEDETIQPAVCSGLPVPVLPPVAAPVQSATESGAETTMASAENSTAATQTIEVASPKASAVALTEATSADDSSVNSSEATSELLKMLDQGDSGVEKGLAVDLKPLKQSMDKEVGMTKTELPPMAKQISRTGIEELSPAEVTLAASQPRQTVGEMPQIPAATAREVALGVSRKESALVSQADISQTSIPADVGVADSAVVSPITTEEARRSACADRSALTEPPEKVRGTAAAKLTMSMNNEANREEIAGLTGQVLPGSGVSQSVTGINLPSESQRIAAKEITSVDSLNAAARLTTGPARTDVSLNTDLLEVREASPAARIGEVISREVRMFKRGGDDMVEVVLTPDAKTQISLKLQWRDGQVEVQARCDMGDHRFLNTQWPQLQASFAAHGVRLSHLSERAHTGFTEFFGNSGFSQQQGGERQPTPQPSAIDVMKPVVPTPKTGAARSVVRSSNRLESWA